MTKMQLLTSYIKEGWHRTALSLSQYEDLMFRSGK